MARKKLKLAWIANDQSRKATLKKRKKGLLKKVRELSTLCDVNACAIIYSPNETLPEIWPSYTETQDVLFRFTSLPHGEQIKKMLTQAGFLKHQLVRLKEQHRKLEKENHDCQITILLYQILVGKGLEYLSMDVMSDLTTLVDSKLKTVQERIESLTKRATANLTEENRALEMAIEAYNKQQWLVKMLSSNVVRDVGTEDSVMPFGVSSSSWFNPSR